MDPCRNGYLSRRSKAKPNLLFQWGRARLGTDAAAVTSGRSSSTRCLNGADQLQQALASSVLRCHRDCLLAPGLTGRAEPLLPRPVPGPHRESCRRRGILQVTVRQCMSQAVFLWSRTGRRRETPLYAVGSPVSARGGGRSSACLAASAWPKPWTGSPVGWTGPPVHWTRGLPGWTGATIIGLKGLSTGQDGLDCPTWASPRCPIFGPPYIGPKLARESNPTAAPLDDIPL